MTTFYVCLCRKYDEKQDLENDLRDNNEPLNIKVIVFFLKMLKKVKKTFFFHYRKGFHQVISRQ